VTVPIESIEHAAREMLRLGAEAEVMRPIALRAQMRQQTARMAGLYATP
jgi:hypothetical protein